MPSIVIVETNGNLKEQTVRSISEDEIYKKAGLKSSEGFGVRATWAVTLAGKMYDISVYGKIVGRAGQENKYEFPPPIDSTLLFGKCVLVNSKSDLKVADWNRVYEHLYGGFDDIGDDDSTEEDDELDENAVLTKTGYLKDDFVVDDDEDEDADEEDESEEEECDDISDEEVVSKTKSKGKKGAKKGRKPTAIGKSKCLHNKASSIAQPSYLDCTSELEEEKYV
jgi:hypothetical protein